MAISQAELYDDSSVIIQIKKLKDGKQDKLTPSEIEAIDSGITAEKVAGYDSHVANSNIHVTAAQKTEWNDAALKRHEHANKSVIDVITAADIQNWDDAADLKHSHTNKALLDTYQQTESDLADAVDKKHEHANKSTLDTISAAKTASWDAKQDALPEKVSDRYLHTNASTGDLEWVSGTGEAGVNDVQVDGVSVVTGGVAQIDLSGKATPSDITSAISTHNSAADAHGGIVHTSGSETIGGVKSFTDTPVSYAAEPGITLKSSATSRTETPAADKTAGKLDFKGQDDGVIASLATKKYTTGLNEASLQTNGADGTIGIFKVAVASDGTRYAQAPSRSYASAASDDVLTKGHVGGISELVHTTGNEEKAGNLGLRDTLFYTRSTSKSVDDEEIWAIAQVFGYDKNGVPMGSLNTISATNFMVRKTFLSCFTKDATNHAELQLVVLEPLNADPYCALILRDLNGVEHVIAQH